ncbi:miraculin-like [Bidens hawaiensis]|uniref:miraculin-like n=1 Tax=Bidens hawaiensis TaxID=980011 RepID=UPI00404B4DD9
MNITCSFTFILIFTLTLLSATSAVIYDSSGNKLLTGIPYYILPLLRGTGGGLTVTRATKDACPLNVTQEPFEVNNGVPFTFTPIVLDEQIIRGAYPISIEANVINPCSGSNIWKVTSTALKKHEENALLTSKKDKDKNKNKKKKDDDDDDDKNKDVANVETVTTGGEFNKPESCFQIVEDNLMPGLQSYQIQNCPFKCGPSSSGYTCYNIGVVTDADGNGYLARTDAVFPVVFTSSYGAFSTSAKVSTFSQLSAKVSALSLSVK